MKFNSISLNYNALRIMKLKYSTIMTQYFEGKGNIF